MAAQTDLTTLFRDLPQETFSDIQFWVYLSLILDSRRSFYLAQVTSAKRDAVLRRISNLIQETEDYLSALSTRAVDSALLAQDVGNQRVVDLSRYETLRPKQEGEFRERIESMYSDISGLVDEANTLSATLRSWIPNLSEIDTYTSTAKSKLEELIRGNSDPFGYAGVHKNIDNYIMDLPYSLIEETTLETARPGVKEVETKGAPFTIPADLNISIGTDSYVIPATTPVCYSLTRGPYLVEASVNDPLYFAYTFTVPALDGEAELATTSGVLSVDAVAAAITAEGFTAVSDDGFLKITAATPFVIRPTRFSAAASLYTENNPAMDPDLSSAQEISEETGWRIKEKEVYSGYAEITGSEITVPVDLSAYSGRYLLTLENIPGLYYVEPDLTVVVYTAQEVPENFEGEVRLYQQTLVVEVTGGELISGADSLGIPDQTVQIETTKFLSGATKSREVGDYFIAGQDTYEVTSPKTEEVHLTPALLPTSGEFFKRSTYDFRVASFDDVSMPEIPYKEQYLSAPVLAQIVTQLRSARLDLLNSIQNLDYGLQNTISEDYQEYIQELLITRGYDYAYDLVLAGKWADFFTLSNRSASYNGLVNILADGLRNG